jgi:hypothetical protein
MKYKKTLIVLSVSVLLIICAGYLATLHHGSVPFVLWIISCIGTGISGKLAADKK